MYMRVKGEEGIVEITAPQRMKVEQIEEFVQSRMDWIMKARKRQKELANNKDDVVLAPFREREIRYELKKKIQNMITKWEPIMNVKSSGFTIKKMKTRWGSCNVKSHHLNFNFYLYKVEDQCIEYVVVHELIHLLEPSHNARFWSLVEYYLPGSKELKKKLNSY